MRFPDENTTLTLTDKHAEEARMRTALGLTPNGGVSRGPDSDHTRASPARGAQVPVTVIGARRASEPSDALRQRLAALEASLQAERSERIVAQKALAEAQGTIQQLQTKLAHAEIAASEALEAERAALRTVQARMEELAPPAPPQPEPSSVPKKRGRPPRATSQPALRVPEPEPVKWWLPSYQAAKKRGSSRSG